MRVLILRRRSVCFERSGVVKYRRLRGNRAVRSFASLERAANAGIVVQGNAELRYRSKIVLLDRIRVGQLARVGVDIELGDNRRHDTAAKEDAADVLVMGSFLYQGTSRCS